MKILSYSILILVSIIFLSGCTTQDKPVLYHQQLVNDIYQHLPKLNKQNIIVSVRYETKYNITTVIMVNEKQMKEYTITIENNDYIVSLTKDMNEVQIKQLIACHEAFNSLNVDPEEAIDRVNTQYNINEDLAVFAPYLDDFRQGCRQPVWSIHGNNGFYLVDSTNGQILRGYTLP